MCQLYRVDELLAQSQLALSPDPAPALESGSNPNSSHGPQGLLDHGHYVSPSAKFTVVILTAIRFPEPQIHDRPNSLVSNTGYSFSRY